MSLPASRKTAEKSRGHRRRKPSSEPVQQNDDDTLMLLMAMAGPKMRFEYRETALLNRKVLIIMLTIFSGRSYKNFVRTYLEVNRFEN